MTLQTLLTKLKTVCNESYELSAPAGDPRSLVVRELRRERVYSITGEITELNRILLIVSTQQLHDSLLSDVRDLLESLAVPYLEDDSEYIEQDEIIRTKLHLALLDNPSPAYLEFEYTVYPRVHAESCPNALIYDCSLVYNCASSHQYRQEVDTIKRDLLAAGCTYPTETDTSPDYGERRIVLEFEYAKGVDLDG